MSINNKIKELKENENVRIGLLRDIIFVIVTIVVIYSYITLGYWTPMVAVESGSMIPHIRIGDIAFIESIDLTKIITYEEGKKSNYISFGDYGDVILYKPFGKEGVTPIIHRAMYYVEEEKPCGLAGQLPLMQVISQKEIIREQILYMTSKEASVITSL